MKATIATMILFASTMSLAAQRYQNSGFYNNGMPSEQVLERGDRYSGEFLKCRFGNVHLEITMPSTHTARGGGSINLFIQEASFHSRSIFHLLPVDYPAKALLTDRLPITGQTGQKTLDVTFDRSSGSDGISIRGSDGKGNRLHIDGNMKKNCTYEHGSYHSAYVLEQKRAEDRLPPYPTWEGPKAPPYAPPNHREE